MNAKFLCGTPQDSCNGTVSAVSSGLMRSRKAHISPQDAFSCHAKYLRSLGFKQVGSREFQDPSDGTIRVLTRKGKFGARLRTGKENTRHMPGRPRTGGLIISR